MEKEDKLKSNGEFFYQSMRITTDSRYEASKRLKNLEKFNFIATTIVSLGLIFIPLLQLSGLKLYYESKVLSAIQIFFAVAVLVYSVVNSTSRYSERAIELNKCADLLRDLSKRFKYLMADKKLTNEDLESFNKEYRSCLEKSENHSDLDYKIIKLTLDLKDLKKKVKDKDRKWSWGSCIKAIFIHFLLCVNKLRRLWQYILSLAMVVFVLIVISDILGVTKILYPFLIVVA